MLSPSRLLFRTATRRAPGRFVSTGSPVVGFLGLGNMGLPMAANLAKHREVLAFDASEQALERAAERGIPTVSSLEEVAGSASTIVTMLPGDAALDAVLECLRAHCQEGTGVIDCSTVGPSTSRRWHQTLADDGHWLIDAPVSGGVKGAEDATLTFMVGSDETTTNEKAKPLLECMGKRVVACGGPGAGAVVKLCNNLALAAQMIGVCEAMSLGESLGVDPVVLADVMNTSTAKSWSCEVNNPHPAVTASTGSPASKGYEGGFGARLMLKDLGLAVAAASGEGVALPLGNAAKEIYQLAERRGLGDKDFGVVLPFLQGK